MNLSGKIVTVIGLGQSGKAAARLLLEKGAQVKISDRSNKKESDAGFLEWARQNNIIIEFGSHTQAFIQASDLVILSPGVRINQDCVLWARQADIPVWGEVELASRFCLYPIIAVTGSNGKTTVSTLIRDVLARAGRQVALCGNIGYPLSAVVMESMTYDYIVCEISSFQLETIRQFKPHIAVFLNFSQNHLDWHNDMEEYFTAKRRIFMNQDAQDHAVLNKKDKMLAGLAQDLKAQCHFFNTGSAVEKKVSSNPDYLAAFCAARIAGVDARISQDVFDNFQGVEHRLEKVRVLDDVVYINDSKATTAEAGRWALESMANPVIMICGGKDKNIDFSILRDLVKKKVKKMILIGEAKEKLKQTFYSVVPIAECPDLKAAVLTARQNAQAGDWVLFSPMCASFDMFKNFEERGKIFKELVRAL